MDAFWMMVLAQIVVPAIIQAIKERDPNLPVADMNVVAVAEDPKGAVEAIIKDPAQKANAITVLAGWVGGILDLLSGKKKP
jgi:hypothetical protein